MVTLDSTRFTLFDTPDYRLELEYTEQFAIFHLAEVHRFTPRVLRRMVDHFIELRTFLLLHYKAVHTAVEHGRDDLHRLTKYIGMKPLYRDGQYTIYTTEDIEYAKGRRQELLSGP